MLKIPQFTRWVFIGPIGPLASARTIFDLLMWLFILILPFILLLALFDWIFSSDEYASSNNNSPREILKRRYASGEITKEEFNKKLHDLKEMV